MLTSGFETLTKVDLQPLDAGSELRRLLEPLRSSGVKVVDQIEGGLCLGDAEYFRIIVDHIINNAQKFGPEDGTIYVRAYSSHGHCVVEIEDEGPGVPPEFRERIFERFFQIDASSTRAHGGVGLGLFITRKLVEAMGGDLELVDAARGSGSIFRVRLPTGRNSPTTASEHHGTEA